MRCARKQFPEPIQQIHPTGKSPKSPSSPSRKNILIFRSRKSVYTERIPSHQEGRFANVTNAGRGCGGRGGARDGRCRSVRPSRMVPTPPTKVSSLRSFPQATVAMSRAHRGDHEATVKPPRRESRIASAGPVCSCALLPLHCTRDRGCSAHPAFPAPLIGEGVTSMANLGRMAPRDREVVSRHVMASFSNAAVIPGRAKHEPGISRFPDVQLHI